MTLILSVDRHCSYRAICERPSKYQPIQLAAIASDGQAQHTRRSDHDAELAVS